jgi:hypothetical protein
MSVSLWPFLGRVKARSETLDPARALLRARQGKQEIAEKRVAQKRT